MTECSASNTDWGTLDTGVARRNENRPRFREVPAAAALFATASSHLRVSNVLACAWYRLGGSGFGQDLWWDGVWHCTNQADMVVDNFTTFFIKVGWLQHHNKPHHDKQTG